MLISIFHMKNLHMIGCEQNEVTNQDICYNPIFNKNIEAYRRMKQMLVTFLSGRISSDSIFLCSVYIYIYVLPKILYTVKNPLTANWILLCTRHCCKCFMCLNSFKLCNSTRRAITIFRISDEETEAQRLNNLPKISWIETDRA